MGVPCTDHEYFHLRYVCLHWEVSTAHSTHPCKLTRLDALWTAPWHGVVTSTSSGNIQKRKLLRTVRAYDREKKREGKVVVVVVVEGGEEEQKIQFWNKYKIQKLPSPYNMAMASVTRWEKEHLTQKLAHNQ